MYIYTHIYIYIILGRYMHISIYFSYRIICGMIISIFLREQKFCNQADAAHGLPTHFSETLSEVSQQFFQQWCNNMGSGWPLKSRFWF